MAGFIVSLFFVLPLLLVPIVFYRILIITNPKRDKPIRHGRRNRHELSHLMIVLGSGGHTAEMIAMLERAVTAPKDSAETKINWNDYTHRTWVVGEGDTISAQRAKEFEEMATKLAAQDDDMVGNVKKIISNVKGNYDIATVPRAREIHQPLATSPISSAKCMKACYDLLLKRTSTNRDGHLSQSGEIDFPDVILCNGPATATILVFTSMLLRFFDVKGCSTRNKMRTIYVESWARVKKLSLSGRLLKNVVDRFLVQWPQLERSAGGRAEYLGVLV